jgi:NADPH:quinone reductase-like Zn-dependent oxidoreductase
MAAVQLLGHGGFEMLAYREDVPVPRPAAGEVLIRVAAAGVNNTDINTRIGWYAKKGSAGGGWSGGLTFPRIQGADVVGRIVAVGAGVDGSRIGERVLVEPCLHLSDAPLGETAYLGSERDGGFAQYCSVPAAFAWPIETPLSDAELASFPCSWSTAENLLTRACLTAGELVLVTGSSGGVGSAAVQLARCRGAEVIAVASVAKVPEVQALGAGRVIRRGTDLVEAVGRERVDVVIDLVGGPHWPQLLEILVRGGRYATAGAIAGPVVELDLRTLYLKDLKLFGGTVLGAGVFERLVGLIEQGSVRPVLAATYPLHEIVRAQQDFLAKAHTGKLVLLPPT